MKKLCKLISDKVTNTYIEKILIFALAFLGLWGVSYVFGLVYDRQLSSSFWAVPLYGFIAGMLVYCNRLEKEYEEKKRKRLNRFSYLTALVFSILYVLGYQLQQNNMTECGFSGKLHILAMSILLSFAIFPVMVLSYILFEKVNEIKLNGETVVKKKKIFFISWAVLFAAFIPAFLAYYPIVMSYDFHSQVLMSERGYIWFSQHHPQIHTFQISCFYNLGKAIGNIQTGMALMSIFHMLVMSVCMAYGVLIVSKLIPSKKTPYIVTALLAIYPINAVMTVSTTKDVMFSALFLLFFCTLVDRFYFSETKKQKILMDVFVVLSGILMSLYRNNASYAVLASGLILVLCVPKKLKLIILAYTILIFVGYKLSFNGIRAMLGTTIGTEPIEKYSAIIQAYARVGYYHADDMDEETEYIINYYLPKESWVEYNPQLSDACKAGAAYVYWEHWDVDMKKTLSDFIKIGLKYPNEYLDSFLETNRGYWFIDDTSYNTCLGSGLEGRMGVLYTYNSSYSEGEVEEIKHETKFGLAEKVYENIVSANCYENWPIVSNFFKTSFYTLLLYWLFFIYIYLKNYKALLMSIFPCVYMGTMFLGPIVQIRYSFPIMLISIILTVISVVKYEKTPKLQKSLKKAVEN